MYRNRNVVSTNLTKQRQAPTSIRAFSLLLLTESSTDYFFTSLPSTRQLSKQTTLDKAMNVFINRGIAKVSWPFLTIYPFFQLSEEMPTLCWKVPGVELPKGCSTCSIHSRDFLWLLMMFIVVFFYYNVAFLVIFEYFF